MRNTLSDRQRKMLAYIHEFSTERHYPPSLQEIRAAVELKSASTVKGHLDRLRKSGYVTWEEGKARTIRVIKEAM